MVARNERGRAANRGPPSLVTIAPIALLPEVRQHEEVDLRVAGTGEVVVSPLVPCRAAEPERRREAVFHRRADLVAVRGEVVARALVHHLATGEQLAGTDALRRAETAPHVL